MYCTSRTVWGIWFKLINSTTWLKWNSSISVTTEDIKDNIIKTSSRIRAAPKKQLCEVPIMDSSKDHVAGRVKIGGKTFTVKV